MNNFLLHKFANQKLKEYADLDMIQKYALYHNLGVYYCAEGHILHGLKNRINFLYGYYFLLKSQKNNPTYINYTFLGYISYQKKKYKSAIRYYQMASKMMFAWECEYNLALSFYKDGQKKNAFLKIRRLYDLIHNQKIFIDEYTREDAFYLIDSFYFLLLAQNKISPLNIVEKSYIFQNCSLDCGLYIGFFLGDYEITYHFLQKIFVQNPRIDFKIESYALIVDCLLQKNDMNFLKKILYYYSYDKTILQLFNRLITDQKYRKKCLDQIQLNPESAEFLEQMIFKNKVN